MFQYASMHLYHYACSIEEIFLYVFLERLKKYFLVIGTENYIDIVLTSLITLEILVKKSIQSLIHDLYTVISSKKILFNMFLQYYIHSNIFGMHNYSTTR